MIYTLTVNPSLDYIVRTNDFKPGQINRTTYEEILPGGKGINVSIVLKNLGVDSTAFGFTAGFTGAEIRKEVEQFGCRTDFIDLSGGMSRINVKLKSNEETEINGQGPNITDADLQRLFDKMDCLSDGDILVLAGSIPNTLPEDLYERILDRLKEKKIQVVVDATKDLLVKVLKFHPFLIKPNNHELGEIFGVTITAKEDVVIYARKMQEMGARNVLISMAGDGAVFVGEDGEVYESEAPQGTVINSVGAGDSMVAGFLYGYLQTKQLPCAFKMGIATGSASAFSEKLADKEQALNLMSQIGREYLCGL